MIAFLGYPGGFGHWLIYHDHLPNLLINWCIGVFLTCVVLGAILRPLVRRAKEIVMREWREHKNAQREIVASNDRMASALDTHTAVMRSMTAAIVKERGDG